MTLLQIGFVVDAVVTFPFALATLIGCERWAQLLFRESLPESHSLRTILGSLWMAILMCSLVGVFFPVEMSPVLILQLIYKGLWIAWFAIPRWLSGRSAEVPWRIAGIFLAFILVYPWIIPWTRLLDWGQ